VRFCKKERGKRTHYSTAFFHEIKKGSASGIGKDFQGIKIGGTKREKSSHDPIARVGDLVSW